MYPSISICKKYSFEYEMFDEDDFEGVNDTDDVSSRVEFMIKNFSYYSLDLDDQVYFFSQPGVMSMTYPCTTTLAAKLPVSQGVGDVDSAPCHPDSTPTSGPTRSLAYFCRW